MPKRVLLMHISQVSGHRSASLAIEKSLKTLSSGTELLNINAFQYTNPISEKIVNRIYMTIINKAPKIWEYLYDNPRVAKKLRMWKNFVHKLNSPKLKNLFDSFHPDAIICTQAFPCGMVADYKRAYNSDVPLIAVLTDFVPHSYWIYNEVNFFISPSDEVSAKLVSKGVPQEKIKCLGIPFDPKFNLPVDKKSVCANLGLNPKIPIILIMGGSHGLGPIKTIIRSLEKVKNDFQSIIIAGANKRLYRSLKKKTLKLRKKSLLFGYSENIHELMSISDIIITKPGGITTSEALAKKLPMIMVKPLPGQEANNATYLTKKKAAIKVENLKQINLVVEDLLNNPDKLKRMQEAASAISKPNSSIDIARLILDLE